MSKLTQKMGRIWQSGESKTNSRSKKGEVTMSKLTQKMGRIWQSGESKTNSRSKKGEVAMNKLLQRMGRPPWGSKGFLTFAVLGLVGVLLLASSSGVWATPNQYPLQQTLPLAAVDDFDGDGKSDAVLYRDGVWFIKPSGGGAMIVIVHGGLAQDKPIVGDFDGDGKSDAALYRDGVWYIKPSGGGAMMVIVHGGLAQDKVVNRQPPP